MLQLHFEGWNKTSIAAYLKITRHTVDDILQRWAEEQFAGLHNKSRRPHRLIQKQTLQMLLTVRELQENPLLGEFRVDFGKATSWEELLLVHEQWLEHYNAQEHWGHQKREDGRKSPRAVLGTSETTSI